VVRIHWSTLALPFAVAGYALYTGTSVQGMLWMVGFLLAVIACVFLHEVGHAYAARRYGVSVFDILLLPVGGVARLRALPSKPFEEVWVALAGPLVNLLIALLLLPALWYWPRHEWFPWLNNYDLGSALVCLSLFNAAVFVFNLIPAFPLDGGRILRASLCNKMSRLKSTKVTAWVSRIIGLGLLAFDPTTPITELVEYLNRSGHGGAIVVDECCPIGFVTLRFLARIEDQSVQVGSLEMPTVICHDSHTPLRDLSQQFSIYPKSIAIEESDGRPVGYLDLDLLDQSFQAFAKTA